MGKGCERRPTAVSEEEADRRWAEIDWNHGRECDGCHARQCEKFEQPDGRLLCAECVAELVKDE